MSVKIICDRCGEDTRLRFLRAKIEVTRGVYASTSSQISPAALPWTRDWHICESCYRELQRWSDPPPRAVPA